MSHPEILEEKQIIRLDEMCLLWNPTDADAEMKFDGRTYLIPSQKFLRLRQSVATALMMNYSHLGIVQVRDTSPEELALKKQVGLKALHASLMDQLHCWIEWAGDQKRYGREIFGEPLRVKELKILISDMEDMLGLPRMLGQSVYEEIEDDRERLKKMNRGRSPSIIAGPFVPQPLKPQSEQPRARARRSRSKSLQPPIIQPSIQENEIPQLL